MTGIASDLLRSLASRGGAGEIRPSTSIPRMPRAAELGAAGTDFATLLERARSAGLDAGSEDVGALVGKVGGGESAPVNIAPGLELNLSTEQQTRLRQAADQAAAMGLTRALVVLDGKAMKLDVGVRSISDVVDLSNAHVLTGIDGIVSAGQHTLGTTSTPGETSGTTPRQGGIGLGSLGTVGVSDSLRRALDRPAA
ncbi:MAG: hypothetical protein SFZ23_01010 [Planctomycetota bacterium]|nr:hypothetical protein [Planctomycetota bacterium]